MRYVQSLPPIVEPVPDSGAVKPVAGTHATPRVRERTLPALVYHPHAPPPQAPAINRRVRPPAAAGDRRRLCRRLRDVPVLLELRSGKDRRRRNQRRGDLATAIDEQA